MVRQLCFGPDMDRGPAKRFGLEVGRVRKSCLAMILMSTAVPGWAQEVAAPDPASIAVPDLDIPPQQLGDPKKFFFFHKSGVTFEAARQDLAFCSRYIARGAVRGYPGFVPWQSAPPAEPIVQNLNYGLVGVAIMAIISGPIDRSIRQSRMMRCMLPRGYARYRTSEDLWKQLNGGDLAQSILVQAKIASGPVPPTERTLP